jgi:choline dehydrogenase
LRSRPRGWPRHHITFNGKRATGIVFSRADGVEVADAAREVILAAGAVGSPHLLQLSGVGNPDDLAKANIPVHHPLPGVGHNFQDHYIARMSCEVRGIETLNERAVAACRSPASCGDTSRPGPGC